MNQVVARFQDGRVVKGTSLDVDPNKPICHIRQPDGPMVEVKLEDLKALFFVRTLEGQPERTAVSELDPADPRARGQTPESLRFADGEVISGLTIRYPPNRPYFFVLPVDKDGNNIRILINRAGVASMEAGT
jgi:hypothetical protein